jgi:RNA polymerase sigma-70 factor, ECF subfamily
MPADSPPLLERLFTESAGDLLRYFSRRHGDDHDAARDLVQETFLQLARSLESGRQVHCGRGYLFGIARRVSQAFWSDCGASQETPFDAESAALAAPAVDDRIAAARETIAELDDSQREILDLRFAQALSYAEIAEALAIPLGTVRSRLHHAIAEVRHRLQKDHLL